MKAAGKPVLRAEGNWHLGGDVFAEDILIEDVGLVDGGIEWTSVKESRVNRVRVFASSGRLATPAFRMEACIVNSVRDTKLTNFDIGLYLFNNSNANEFTQVRCNGHSRAGVEIDGPLSANNMFTGGAIEGNGQAGKYPGMRVGRTQQVVNLSLRGTHFEWNRSGDLGQLAIGGEEGSGSSFTSVSARDCYFSAGGTFLIDQPHWGIRVHRAVVDCDSCKTLAHKFAAVYLGAESRDFFWRGGMPADMAGATVTAGPGKPAYLYHDARHEWNSGVATLYLRDTIFTFKKGAAEAVPVVN